LRNISLGQGQDKSAYNLFRLSVEDGHWLLYQNTHLYVSWMPQLIKIVELMNDPEVHSEFRLFLSTSSSLDFPVSILQDGIKVTVETSGDVKQMMLNA